MDLTRRPTFWPQQQGLPLVVGSVDEVNLLYGHNKAVNILLVVMDNVDLIHRPDKEVKFVHGPKEKGNLIHRQDDKGASPTDPTRK